MGKKLQGAALRAKKRQKEWIEELQERQAEQVSQAGVKDDADAGRLFVLDFTGDATLLPLKHDDVTKNEKKTKKTTIWNEKEQQAMNRLTQNYTKQELLAMVKAGQHLYAKDNPLKTHGIRKANNNKKKRVMEDLWNEQLSDTFVVQKKKISRIAGGTSMPLVPVVEESKVVPKPDVEPQQQVEHHPSSTSSSSSLPKTLSTLAKKTSLADKMPKAGQSYRPDPLHHQVALREALTIEERRNHAEAESKAPISPGMSPATRALLLTDDTTSDEEESNHNDHDHDDKNNNNNASPEQPVDANVFHKQQPKLTRAQRNRQKRIRQEEMERKKSKKQRIQENTIYQLARIQKEVKQQQVKPKPEKQETLFPKGLETVVSEQEPLQAPTFPIALSRENDTLRTIQPKGNGMTDFSLLQFQLQHKLASSHPVSSASLSNPKQPHPKTKPLPRRKRTKVKGRQEWEGTNFVIFK